MSLEKIAVPDGVVVLGNMDEQSCMGWESMAWWEKTGMKNFAGRNPDAKNCSVIVQNEKVIAYGESRALHAYLRVIDPLCNHQAAVAYFRR